MEGQSGIETRSRLLLVHSNLTTHVVPRGSSFNKTRKSKRTSSIFPSGHSSGAPIHVDSTASDPFPLEQAHASVRTFSKIPAPAPPTPNLPSRLQRNSILRDENVRSRKSLEYCPEVKVCIQNYVMTSQQLDHIGRLVKSMDQPQPLRDPSSAPEVADVRNAMISRSLQTLHAVSTASRPLRTSDPSVRSASSAASSDKACCPGFFRALRRFFGPRKRKEVRPVSPTRTVTSIDLTCVEVASPGSAYSHRLRF